MPFLVWFWECFQKRSAGWGDGPGQCGQASSHPWGPEGNKEVQEGWVCPHWGQDVALHLDMALLVLMLWVCGVSTSRPLHPLGSPSLGLGFTMSPSVPQAFLLRLNFSTSFPGFPVCGYPVVTSWFSLRAWANYTIYHLLYVCMHTVLSYSLENHS